MIDSIYLLEQKQDPYIKVKVFAIGADHRILVSNLKLKRRAIGNGSIPPLYFNPLIFSSHITGLSLVEKKKY